jgi:hypothetical protein
VHLQAASKIVESLKLTINVHALSSFTTSSLVAVSDNKSYPNFSQEILTKENTYSLDGLEYTYGPFSNLDNFSSWFFTAAEVGRVELQEE